MEPPQRERRAHEVLARLAEELPGGALLHRGPDVSGDDVDVLIVGGRQHAAARVLRGCGLAPAVQDDGRVLWRSFDGSGLVVDALPAHAWPPYWPPLEGVLERRIEADAPLPVAAAEDRLLMRAAELVAGAGLAKTLRKIGALLAEPGAAERLRGLAREEELEPLAELVADPAPLEAAAASGASRLPLRRALRAARGSAQGSAALRARLAARAGIVRRAAPPPATAGGKGLLVALSGMDGAGKSTAALELAARLEAHGRTAFVAWARLAADSEILDLIAGPVRRLLRRRGQIADPAAAGAPVEDGAASRRTGGEDRGSRGPVEWTWVVIVAAINARSCRRSARLRRGGLVVICDRWLPDALVDLELRYGRHRAAEWVLRKGVPRPDLSVVLDIDAATAERRKPGDQPASVLARMAGSYERVTRELGFGGAGPRSNGRVLIDARGDQAAVVAELEQQIAQRLG